jgi:ATP-dependent DNA helicase RecQ
VTLEWTTKKYTPAPRVKAAKAAAVVALPASDTTSDSLREKLRGWRRDLAKQQSVPAYVILHDATLDALCRQRPRDLGELLEIPGIGERKAERFGAKILELITGS